MDLCTVAIYVCVWYILNVNTLIVLLTAIVSLLANPKVQSNPALLAQVSRMSQTVSALVFEYNQNPATTTVATPTTLPPSVSLNEQVPLGAAPLIPTPTSTPSGTPIVYVGEQDTQPAPESCTLHASVAPTHMIGQPKDKLDALTSFSWQVFNMPTSTKGTVLPIDIAAGNVSPHNLWPEDGKFISTDWSYYSGGAVATFDNATCTTYFPVEPSYTFVPTSTIFSTQNPN